MTPKQHEILNLLVRSDKPVPSKRIAEEVIGLDTCEYSFHNSKNVHTQVSKVRSYLKTIGVILPQLKPYRGYGYFLTEEQKQVIRNAKKC